MTCPTCKGRGALLHIQDGPPCPKCKGVGQLPDSANQMTADLLVQIPKRFPGTRLWRANTGVAYGADGVKAAIQCLHRGDIKGALEYLQRRPIHFGVDGQGDISGIAAGEATGAGLGVRVEIEVKAGRDKMSDQQIAFRRMILAAGGIYLECHEVESTLRELEVRLK